MNSELQQWYEKGDFFDYQGHQIFYRDSQTQKDDKPCVVCVHGFPVSSWDWRYLWPELSLNYRVIAPDMLGFGFSDKPAQHSYTVIEQADIIEALIKACGVTNYHLIAHDFGTLVAQELLDRDSSVNIQSLFSMSGSIFPELSNPRLIQKLLTSKVGPLITRLFNQQRFNRSLQRVFSSNFELSNEVLEAYWNLLSHNQGDQLLHKLNFFLTDRKQHGERWAKAWQTSPVPIRYLVGSVDPMYGQSVVEQLKSLSKRKDIHVLPGVGHFPHLESVRKVADQFWDFVSNLEASLTST